MGNNNSNQYQTSFVIHDIKPHKHIIELNYPKSVCKDFEIYEDMLQKIYEQIITMAFSWEDLSKCFIKNGKNIERRFYNDDGIPIDVYQRNYAANNDILTIQVYEFIHQLYKNLGCEDLFNIIKDQSPSEKVSNKWKNYSLCKFKQYVEKYGKDNIEINCWLRNLAAHRHKAAHRMSSYIEKAQRKTAYDSAYETGIARGYSDVAQYAENTAAQQSSTTHFFKCYSYIHSTQGIVSATHADIVSKLFSQIWTYATELLKENYSEASIKVKCAFKEQEPKYVYHRSYNIRLLNGVIWDTDLNTDGKK